MPCRGRECENEAREPEVGRICPFREVNCSTSASVYFFFQICAASVSFLFRPSSLCAPSLSRCLCFWFHIIHSLSSMATPTVIMNQDDGSHPPLLPPGVHIDSHDVDYIGMAVPFFLVTLIIEACVSFAKNKKHHRFNDR